MSKKMKLSLEDLKVKSFVTSINDDEKKDVKGGTITILTFLLSCFDDTIEDWTETGDPNGVCGCGGGGTNTGGGGPRHPQP